MDILYLTTAEEDYLQDQILIGFRQLFGSSVIDYPKKEKLYKTCNIPSSELYGHGFTIWKTLEDINIDRDNALLKLKNNQLDLIIFGSICRQIDFFDTFQKHNFFNNKCKFIFLDGEDHPLVFNPAIKLGNYFKREITKPIPGINKISFSIPSHKIMSTDIDKKKKFTKHVQCAEAYKIDEVKNNCSDKYLFTSENEYYQDLAESMYGFTMKKGGWDCMRHYELAANGAVPCFYKFDNKPIYSAPHDLFDMKNIVTFNTAEELETKLEFIDKNNMYNTIKSNTLNWAQKHTCEKTAEYILNIVNTNKINL